MYRDDRDAMLLRLDQLTRESEQNRAVRAELLELRQALSSQPSGNPYSPAARFGPGEAAMLAEHGLMAFPAPLMTLLCLLTLGLFPLAWFGVQQGRMPRAASNDPTTGQSIGFQFIPFFNLYWTIFNSIRISDRITLQFRLRGSDEQAPKSMMLATSVCGVIPYVNILSLFVLWPIATALLQHSINRVIALGPPPPALFGNQPPPLPVPAPR